MDSSVKGGKVKSNLSTIIAFAISLAVFISFLGLPLMSMFPVQMAVLYTKYAGSFVKEQNSIALSFINAVKSGDYQNALSMLHQDIRPSTPEPIEKIHAEIVRLGNAKAINILDTRHSFTAADTHITYWYDGEKGSAFMTILISGKEDVAVKGFNYSEAKHGEFAELFRLPSPHKISVMHYFAALIALFLIWFTADTLIKCGQSNVGFKFLWFAFIMTGIFMIGIEWKESSWDSARLHFNLLSIQFFSVGITKINIMVPAILKISFPIGAIVFRLVLNAGKKSVKSI